MRKIIIVVIPLFFTMIAPGQKAETKEENAQYLLFNYTTIANSRFIAYLHAINAIQKSVQVFR